MPRARYCGHAGNAAGGYGGYAHARTDEETMNTPDIQFHLRTAKHRLSLAAAACLRNEPGAADRADAARREVDALLRASASNCAQAEKMNLMRTRST